MKVKICATRSLEAAGVAYQHGADFFGFVFTPMIKTHAIDIETAKNICKNMKGKISLVGVFQNMPFVQVQNIIVNCDLDYAQFHGDEDQAYIDQIRIKTIKAFRFGGDFDLEKARNYMKKFRVDYYLLDRIKHSEGPMVDLEKARILAKEFPLFLAGGLNPENVKFAIEKVRPLGVDVASGVETNGEQDLEKIKMFIKNAKGAIKT